MNAIQFQLMAVYVAEAFLCICRITWDIKIVTQSAIKTNEVVKITTQLKTQTEEKPSLLLASFIGNQFLFHKDREMNCFLVCFTQQVLLCSYYFARCTRIMQTRFWWYVEIKKHDSKIMRILFSRKLNLNWQKWYC